MRNEKHDGVAETVNFAHSALVTHASTLLRVTILTVFLSASITFSFSFSFL